jgi:hypothetical protein
VYYQGTLIANTTTAIPQIVIPSVQNGGFVSFVVNITVSLNDATFSVINNIITGQSSQFTYQVSGSLYFIPFSLGGNYSYP